MSLRPASDRLSLSKRPEVARQCYVFLEIHSVQDFPGSRSIWRSWGAVWDEADAPATFGRKETGPFLPGAPAEFAVDDERAKRLEDAPRTPRSCQPAPRLPARWRRRNNRRNKHRRRKGYRSQEPFDRGNGSNQRACCRVIIANAALTASFNEIGRSPWSSPQNGAGARYK